jgi:hypothetical protein
MAVCFLATLAIEGEELGIHLYLIARHLLIVTICVDFAHIGLTRKPADIVAAKVARNSSVGDFDVVKARILINLRSCLQRSSRTLSKAVGGDWLAVFFGIGI